MNYKVATLISTILLASCTTIPASESEDSLVLSTVLDQQCSELDGTKISVLLSSSRHVDPEYLGYQKHALSRSASKSLVERNGGSAPLPIHSLCSKYVQLSPAEEQAFAAAITDGFWKPSSDKFGGASSIVALSLPGYSRDGRTAIVQVSILCGFMCGGGSYWVLHKQPDGRWVVQDITTAWVV